MRFSKLDTNNWKPLLTFRKRLIAGEVALEPSTASVAPTEQDSEITTAHGIRNMTCRPISAAKKQQILDLARMAMSVSQIAAEVGVSETTVRATPAARPRSRPAAGDAPPAMTFIALGSSTLRGVPTSRSGLSSASDGIR